MNWVDYALIAVGLAAFLQGARRGGPRALVGIVGLVAGFGAALLWYPAAAEAIGRTLRIPRSWLDSHWLNTIAFILIVAAGDVAGMLLGLLLAAPRRRASVGSRLFGGAVGLVKGGLWAAIILAVLLASPVSSYAAKDVDRARVASYLVQAERWAVDRLVTRYPERLAHLSPRMKF